MKILLPVLLILPFFSFAQAPAKQKAATGTTTQTKQATATTGQAKQKTAGFTISGRIAGLAEKSKVSITDVNNPIDTLAISKVTNGSFVLKGSVTEPNLLQVNFESAQKKTVLFLGNENVELTGSAENLTDINVKGSRTHEDFMAFQKTFNPLFKRLSELNTQVASNPEANRNDSLMINYSNQFRLIQSAVDQFIAARKSSPVSPFLLVVTSELEQDFTVLEKRLRSLSPQYQDGFYGKILSQQIEEAKFGAVGSDAIAFTQNDTTGKPVSLDSFRGKYVLIDFWASWCRPCRIENPNVVAAYNKFKDKNFTVLGISLDKAREPWIAAIHEDNLAWTQVSDLKFWQNEVAMKYRVQGIPQNFLIGPDGKIVGKNLRGPQLESKLCELLGCN